QGGFKILYAEGSILAFARFDSKKAFITVVSMEDNCRDICLNGRLIGITQNSIIHEVFGENNFCVLENGNINLKINKNKAYLYEVILKP
ncbi:MAG: alpha-glycosidase, partial [Endomicrobia bacterium]|nr:alpha-glycosidase [Endomicrobiia bacterium]